MLHHTMSCCGSIPWKRGVSPAKPFSFVPPPVLQSGVSNVGCCEPHVSLAWVHFYKNELRYTSNDNTEWPALIY